MTFDISVGAAPAPPAPISPPVGGVMMWPSLVPPTGWLICDGSSQLRTDFPDLFALIGVTYGAVDALHFNLPNMRGSMPIGLNPADPDFDAMGETGGAKTHTHTGHNAHVVTQPNNHAAHAVTQPNNHAAHAVTQPNAHAAHAVTQPNAHAAHVVTQPDTHASHDHNITGHDHAIAAHQHEIPFQFPSAQIRKLARFFYGTGSSRASEYQLPAVMSANTTAGGVEMTQSVSTVTDPLPTLPSQGPSVALTHAGTAVDAHSAHAGTAVDAHSAHAGAAVDAHSVHAGTAVDAHSVHAGTGVDAHSAHNTPSSISPYMAWSFIIRWAS